MGGQIAFCCWMSNPAEVSEGAGRLEKEPQINTRILRSSSHAVCLSLFFLYLISPQCFLYPFSSKRCWRALFCLLCHCPLASVFSVFCYWHKISQISCQQGLSRKSTLLTSLSMQTCCFAEESWLLGSDMEQGLWEGWIRCFSFYSWKVIKLPLGLHLEPSP